MRTRRLDRRDEAAIEELLQQEPVLNLFLLGFLAVHPVDRAWWYGVEDGTEGGPLSAVILVLPGRLAVPYAPNPIAADALGRTLRQLHRPCMLVGPREASDHIWAIWGPGAPVLRHYDQRLYTIREGPVAARPAGFRRANDSDTIQVSENAAAMTIEDLGVDPREESASAHLQTVQDRVRAGRTWVIERNGEVLFQVNVGTTSRRGCQIGGTYVPVAHRSHGYATLGVRATCQHLLSHYPLVTLHVNEANVSAVRVYEKVGFLPHQAMRLITVRGAS